MFRRGATEASAFVDSSEIFGKNLDHSVLTQLEHEAVDHEAALLPFVPGLQLGAELLEAELPRFPPIQDLDDVPERVRDELEIHLVGDVREVLDIALEQPA